MRESVSAFWAFEFITSPFCCFCRFDDRVHQRALAWGSVLWEFMARCCWLLCKHQRSHGLCRTFWRKDATATEDHCPLPLPLLFRFSACNFLVISTYLRHFSYMCYLQKEITEEEVLRSQPHAEELVLVYSGGCLPRAARIRRTPLGARKVEMATIRFPVQRSKVKTSKKENFNSCGEATTFQGTYSGVAFRPLS